MSTRKQQLNQLRLPAVRAGMPVRACDITEIQNAINTLQRIFLLDVTHFKNVNAGDPLTAVLMNKMYESVMSLNKKVGIELLWENFPVKSGDPVTEKLFNELIGSINIVIFKSQNDNADVKNYIKLHRQKNSLSDQQLAILNIVWDYYLENNKCIPSRLLFSKIESPKAKDVIEDIGGAFIYETSDNGNKCYQITFLGLTVLSKYVEIEDLLVRYFEFVRAKYLEHPECEQISSEEINARLNLSKKDSILLGKVVSMAHFFYGWMSVPDGGEWFTSFPKDVEELRYIKDLRSYIVEHALNSADLSQPVAEVERYKNMWSQNSLNTDNSEINTKEKIDPQPPNFIRNFLWVRENWKKHWKLIISAVAAIVALSSLSLFLKLILTNKH